MSECTMLTSHYSEQASRNSIISTPSFCVDLEFVLVLMKGKEIVTKKLNRFFFFFPVS